MSIYILRGRTVPWFQWLLYSYSQPWELSPKLDVSISICLFNICTWRSLSCKIQAQNGLLLPHHPWPTKAACALPAWELFSISPFLLLGKSPLSYYLCLRHVSRTRTLQFSGYFFPLLHFKSSNCKFIVIIDQLTKQISLLTCRMQFYPLPWDVLRDAQAKFRPPERQAPR